MKKNILFLDGLMIPVSQKFKERLSPGFLQGKGVFETMRSYNGIIFAEKKHVSRLLNGLKALKIPAPCSVKTLSSYLQRSLSSNRLKNARIRLMVWKEKRKVHVSVVTWPYTAISQMKYQKGFAAIVSDICRNETSKAARLKSIKYLPFLKAWQAARTKGNDEALLLNRKGFLVEGSRTNIFLVRKKVLLTPALSSGCLNGITRRFILQIAKKFHIKQKQTQLSLEDLLGAEEAFLTNSIIEVMPLTSVQGKLIADGKPGAVTRRIQKAYREIVKNQCNQST